MDDADGPRQGRGGQGDRAAVSYLGSTSGENPGSNKSFLGTWRMYVSYTYDRGKHWKTYDATPGSPVQVGSVCTRGTSCTSATRAHTWSNASSV